MLIVSSVRLMALTSNGTTIVILIVFPNFKKDMKFQVKVGRIGNRN